MPFTSFIFFQKIRSNTGAYKIYSRKYMDKSLFILHTFGCHSCIWDKLLGLSGKKLSACNNPKASNENMSFGIDIPYHSYIWLEFLHRVLLRTEFHYLIVFVTSIRYMKKMNVTGTIRICTLFIYIYLNYRLLVIYLVYPKLII